MVRTAFFQEANRSSILLGAAWILEKIILQHLPFGLKVKPTEKLGEILKYQNRLLVIGFPPLN